MSEIKKTGKYAAIYFVGVLLNRSISFIMLPVYTRFLTPGDYGTLELLTMTIDVVAMIAGTAITGAIFPFYYKRDKEEDRNKVISTITILLIFTYFIASSIGLVFSPQIAGLIINGADESILYVRLIFICFFLQAFLEVPLVFLRARQQPVLFVIVSSAKLIIQLSLNIYFVVILKMGVLGVLISLLISSIIIGVGLITYTFRNVGLGFSRNLARSMVIFSLPLVVSSFADFVLTFSDRFFLKAFATLADVGIYSLGYKLGFVLWMFIVRPIFNIWDPQRFEIAEKNDSGEINRRIFFLFNLALISCGFGITLFSKDFFRIMSAREFWAASNIVPIIMLAYIVQGWTLFGNFGLYYKEKTAYLAYANWMAVVSIIILSFLLIPPYGVYGAAVATVLAFSVRFFVIFYHSQRFYRLDLSWRKVVGMLSSAAFCYILSTQFYFDNIILSIAVNSLIFVGYIFLLIILPIFDKPDKILIYNFIRHPVAVLKTR